MTETLTPEERLQHFDHEVEDLKDGFVEAVDQLHRTAEVDASFAERLLEVRTRLSTLRRELRPEDYDKDQVVEFYEALWHIRELLDQADGELDLDVADRLLVCIERIRHVVRDALDEHVSGLENDRGQVVKTLRSRLPGVSQTTIAGLLGINRRTLTRWASESGPPSWDLDLLARLVAILGHNWTEAGVVAWFDRPRRELGGRKPRAVLDDPDFEAALIDSARSGRSQHAS